MKLILRIAAIAVLAAQLGAQSDAPLAVAKRGLTGAVTFTYDAAPLDARPQTDLSAPILIRLERDPHQPNTYVARFLGAVAGDYDLRDLIRRRDGGVPEGLRALPVRVVSELPDELSTDLFEAADIDVAFSGRYHLLALLALIAWLAVPAFAIGRRLLRKAPVEAIVAAPPLPTLADQIRPLVEAAATRSLDVREQGRLELLLYHYWRERLDLGPTDLAAAMRRVRHDSDGGELLGAVEAWLHRPGGASVDADRLTELLAPYRAARAVPEAELAGDAREVATR